MTDRGQSNVVGVALLLGIASDTTGGTGTAQSVAVGDVR